MKFSIKDLVTFIEEILNGEIHFSWSVYFVDAQTNSAISRSVYLHAQIIMCHHCSHTMRAGKCSCVFHCMMSFEGKVLTLPIEVFPHF